MNLLVTGAAGFIGSNFIHYIFDKHPEFHVVGLDKLTYAGNLDNFSSLSEYSKKRFEFIKGDICDRDLLKDLFHRITFSGVINFAAETHVDRSIHDPSIFVKTNVLGTQELLEAAKESWFVDGVQKMPAKFLQISTDEVYGSLGPTGLFTEQTPLNPHSPYSASKASADLLVQAYHDTFGLPTCITRCSNNYGPYQFPEKFIPLIINNALQHKEVPVYGDGRQIRDWLYVEDHCKAIDLVFRRGKVGEVYNIGGSNELANHSILAVVLELLQLMTDDIGINRGLIRYVTDRPGHDRRYGMDASKIRNDLGWEPSTPFILGMRDTIFWYLQNKEWMDKITSGEYKEFYTKHYEGFLKKGNTDESE